MKRSTEDEDCTEPHVLWELPYSTIVQHHSKTVHHKTIALILKSLPFTISSTGVKFILHNCLCVYKDLEILKISTAVYHIRLDSTDNLSVWGEIPDSHCYSSANQLEGNYATIQLLKVSAHDSRIHISHVATLLYIAKSSRGQFHPPHHEHILGGIVDNVMRIIHYICQVYYR